MRLRASTAPASLKAIASILVPPQSMPMRTSGSRRTQAHVDLAPASSPSHGTGEVRPSRKLAGVVPAERCGQLPASSEQAVRELYHAQIGPGLGADRTQVLQQRVLGHLRTGLG